jgi:pimeloyl-ACP methyl ester carboxylesterase
VANPCAQILSPQRDKSTENEGKGVIDASGVERVHPVGHNLGATVAWGVAAETATAEIAVPTGHKIPPHYRRVRIDAAGVITLRYYSTVGCRWMSVKDGVYWRSSARIAARSRALWSPKRWNPR